MNTLVSSESEACPKTKLKISFVHIVSDWRDIYVPDIFYLLHLSCMMKTQLSGLMCHYAQSICLLFEIKGQKVKEHLAAIESLQRVQIDASIQIKEFEAVIASTTSLRISCQSIL